MVDLGEDEEKFDAFMAPLTQTFENLGNVLLNSTRYWFHEILTPKVKFWFDEIFPSIFSNNYNTEEVRKTVIGLARDLRGKNWFHEIFSPKNSLISRFFFLISGIAFAFNTKTSYMMLFDWIYPGKKKRDFTKFFS